MISEEKDAKPMKNKKEKQNRKISTFLPEGRMGVYLVLWAVFLLGLFALFFANVLPGDRAYSRLEDRELSQRPELTLESVADGTYAEAFETWQRDQFPGRDFFFQTGAYLDAWMGKSVRDGVINGKDGYLFEVPEEPDTEKLAEKTEALRRFAKDNEERKVSFMLVPNAAQIMKDKLPAWTKTVDQNAWFAEVKKELGTQITWLDAMTPLKKRSQEDIYFQTDSRWTAKGAGYVFDAVSEELGIPETIKYDMELYGISNTFNGNLSSASGYEAGYKEAMYFYQIKDTTAPQFVVNYLDSGKKTTTLYDLDKLKEKDQYQVFLGGAHPLIDIRTTAENERRLLVVKDSYGNAMVPFLVPYFREILVVDSELFEGDLEELARDNEMTDILFLYNGNTFCREEKLIEILGGASAGE